MNTLRNRILTFLSVTSLAAVASTSITACDDGDGSGNGFVDNLKEQCGLVCPVDGVAQGNASISGIASVDSFFGATIEVQNAALQIRNSMQAELRGLAAALKIEGAASMEMGALATEIKARIEAEVAAKLEGGLTVKYAAPKCEADVELAVKASADCDVDVDPGSVEVSCQGSCEIDASVEAQAECSASGTLKCEATAPGIECMGSCSGTCQLEVAAACEGSCSGTCSGSCSACIGGECETDGSGAVTNCAGTCSGMCQGSCEMSAGGSCSGKCEGSCEYTPPSGSCEAGASVKCEAMANASLDVECKGKCEGTIEPPMVKAECQASVDAKAKANVQCTPPQLEIEYKFAAGVDANGAAEFRALMNVLRTRFAAMIAIEGKLKGVLTAAQSLSAQAGGLIGNVKTELEASGDVDLKVTVGIGCAVGQVGAVGTIMGESVSSLTASAQAFGEVSGSVTAIRR